MPNTLDYWYKRFKNSVKTILECGSALKWKLWAPLGKSFKKLFDNSRSRRHLAISDGSILKTLHIKTPSEELSHQLYLGGVKLAFVQNSLEIRPI